MNDYKLIIHYDVSSTNLVKHAKDQKPISGFEQMESTILTAYYNTVSRHLLFTVIGNTNTNNVGDKCLNLFCH